MGHGGNFPILYGRWVRSSFAAYRSTFVFGSVSSLVLRSFGNIPWRGVPQTAHTSAFNVISAPQQVQNAATLFPPQIALVIWMSGGPAKIHPDTTRAKPRLLCFNQLK